MEAETPKAEPPKRKRRWYQFSLRTLLIVVTVLAVVCAFAASKDVATVRERSALRQRLIDGGSILLPEGVPGYSKPELYSPSWLRRILGDQEVPYIWRGNNCDVPDDEIKRVFPEAYLCAGGIPPVG